MDRSLGIVGFVTLMAAMAVSAVGTVTVFAAEGSSAAGISGAADPLAEVAAPEINDPINEAEMQDLRTIAEQSGMSLEAAIDRYAWNDNFALAVEEVRERYPGAFAGAEIVDADHAWIAFADQAPTEARNVFDGFANNGTDVTVDIRTDVGFTEADLAAAIEDVHFAIYRMPEVRDAATSYDSEARTITTSVVLKDTAQERDFNDVRAVAAKSLRNAAGPGVLDDFATSVVRSNSSVAGGNDSSSYHMGGEDITGCTSGFGTRADSHTSGTRGISTAGHCSNSQTDDGSSLTYRSGHEGTHGDFQWHTGPKTENDNFYSGSSSSTEVNSRDVSGIGFPAVGQSLCKNGITNKKDCQEVRKLDVCSGGECHLIQMSERLAAGGDSGGPVYWGNTAYGLHKGWMYDPFWPFDRDLFSRASRIDNGIGVYIATN